MAGAMQFANRAQKALKSGTQDWQRANDILAVAHTQLPTQRRRAPLTFSGSRPNEGQQ
jgi:hypothetical protein